MSTFSRPRHEPATLAVALLLLCLGAAAPTTLQESERERERSERVEDILAILGARDGARIADVGSADGFYTIRIAKAVAPTGRAFAVDIRQDMLKRLRSRMDREGIANIEPILGDAGNPNLPPGAVDAVLVRNAYHEMAEYRGMLAGIFDGLRPGGLLVIIEPIREPRRHASREEQTKAHEIAPEIVEADLPEAGFEILERQDRFTEFTSPPPGGFWLIRARRP